jgi:hypothetical protein
VLRANATRFRILRLRDLAHTNVFLPNLRFEALSDPENRGEVQRREGDARMMLEGIVLEKRGVAGFSKAINRS